MVSDTLTEAAAERRGELTATPASYPRRLPPTIRVLAPIDEMDAVAHELADRATADLAAMSRHNQRDETGDRLPPV